MASATFGCIGIASALACLRPVFFQGLIVLLGPFHVFVGIVLAASAVINDLNTESHPTFVADITFCFVTAFLVTVSPRGHLDPEKATSQTVCRS